MYTLNKEGKVSQHIEYLPFGETLADEHINSNNSPFKFNGKEYDEETGNYYYSARYYDPKLSIFISVDPKAAKGPGISPYAFCFNNPVRFTDPTGMQIEPGSQAEYTKQRQAILDQRNKIEKEIDNIMTQAFQNNWSDKRISKELGNRQDRYTTLSQTIVDLDTIENSSQVYSLNSNSSNNLLSYDPSTGVIDIRFKGTALFSHEATHAAQFERGESAFYKANGAGFLQDVYDEVGAYKAQWAYDPSSVGVSSLGNINKTGFKIW